MRARTSSVHLPEVLIIEDDENTVKFLQATLEGHGYTTQAATTGHDAIFLFQTRPISIVLLDLNLPDISGFQLSQRMRAISKVPILVVSGRAETQDITRALDNGADDYLVKPFHIEELFARMRVLLRRTERFPAQAPARSIHVQDLEIDLTARRISKKNAYVEVTPTEFDLLVYLAASANSIIRHEELVAYLWGEESPDERESLRVHISNLRHKLEDNPSHPRIIETIPRIGYRLNAQPAGRL